MTTLKQYNEALKSSERYSNLKVSSYGKNLYKCFANVSFANLGQELTSDEKWLQEVINEEIFDTKISTQKKLVSLLPELF